MYNQYVGLNNYFLTNPRDDIDKSNSCTSPRISNVNEEQINIPINDLSNGEKSLKRNMALSSSPMHTLVQMGQDQNVGISISLDPPYSPRAYLNNKHICREDYVVNFIHDLSRHIISRKDEALHDKDPPSQPI